MNEPVIPKEVWEAAIQRRRPVPGGGYFWVFIHRARRHDVGRWGWSISHGGWRRAWHCATCRKTWP